MPAGRFVLRALAGRPPLPDSDLTLPDDIARQVRDVLRLRLSDVIQLVDGVGGEYSATITSITRRAVAVAAGPRREGLPAPQSPIILCLGLLKAAKLELVLQKGTELGVASFQPLLTARSVALVDEFSATKRRRYERIIAEALEQCGGAWLPDLRQPLHLEATLQAAPADAITLIPWEAAHGVSLRSALRLERETRHASQVWLFIGPEGGFSADEVALAERHGALAVTLGPRILRAETAALVAATLTLDALGALEDGPRTSHAGPPD